MKTFAGKFLVADIHKICPMFKYALAIHYFSNFTSLNQTRDK